MRLLSPLFLSVLLALLGSGCGETRAAAPAAIVVTNLEEKEVTPLAMGPGVEATVLIFVMPDCPIANVYAPEMRRLHGDYSGRGVRFYLVYADRDVSAADAREHRRAYEHTIPGLLDPEHALVDLTGAVITPEVAVLTPNGEMPYRGRIDDLYQDFGTRRTEPAERSLRDALDLVLAGRAPEKARTRAIGCFIPDRKEITEVQ